MADVVTQTDQALQTMYNTMLERESIAADPIIGLSGAVMEPGKIPDAAIMRINLKDMQANQVTRMLLSLQGTGYQGSVPNLDSLGEFPQYLTFKTETAEFGHILNRYDVKSTKRGQLLGSEFFNAGTKLQGEWVGLRRGMHIRQGAIEGVSQNLTDPDPGLTARFTKNVHIATVAMGSQPAYDSTVATYIGNIRTALALASTSSDDLPIVDTFSELGYVAFTKWKMRRIGSDYGGKAVIGVSSRVASYLMQFSRPGSAKQLQQTTLSEKIAGKVFASPNIGETPHFVFVEDPRCPIVVLNVTDNTMTVVYWGPGSTDPRLAYTNGTTGGKEYRIFDANIVYGKSGVTLTTAIPVQFRDAFKNVASIHQLRATEVSGVQVTEYDDGVAANRTSSTRVAQGCGLELTYSGPLG